MVPSLEPVFRNLGETEKERLAEAQPLDQGIGALHIARSQCEIASLSIDEIASALEAADVPVTRKAVQNAFSRAGRRVTKRVVQGVRKYSLTIPGIRQAQRLLAVGDLTVLYVDGDQPRTAMKRLADVLSDLHGPVQASDPYYGERSLDVLEMIPEECQTRFLTAHTTEDQGKLRRLIADFRKERPRTEIRLYPNPKELHDRYVLSDERLLVVGHGLKDVGRKESFIFQIGRALAPDLLDTVRGVFDQRWERGTPI